MADRTSAALFGKVFTVLASDPTPQHKQWARELWSQTLEYDFTPYQMDCDEALQVLGLAHKGIDPRYPEDGEGIMYGLR
jgi:hypothetical protein